MGDPMKRHTEPPVHNYQIQAALGRVVDGRHGCRSNRPRVRDEIIDFGETALDRADLIPIEEAREAWALARPLGTSGEPLSAPTPQISPNLRYSGPAAASMGCPRGWLGLKPRSNMSIRQLWHGGAVRGPFKRARGVLL